MIPASFPALLALVSLLALLAYGRAATVPESAPGGLRMYLLAGWMLHAAAIVIDTLGLAPASRVRDSALRPPCR